MSVKALADKGWFLDHYRTELLQDDFFNYSSGQAWTTISATGTAVADDTAGSSKVLLTTAGTIENYCGLKSTLQNFLPAVGHPIWAEARVTYTNQATNNGYVAFGFSSNVALGMTGGGDPTTSMSALLIYKRNGDTTWKCMCSNAGTKTSATSSAAATDGTYHLRIDSNDFDGSNAEVVFSVNGQQLRDSVTNIPIKLKVAYASLVKMNLLIETQAGSGNAQTAFVDFLAAGQLRSGF